MKRALWFAGIGVTISFVGSPAFAETTTTVMLDGTTSTQRMTTRAEALREQAAMARGRAERRRVCMRNALGMSQKVRTSANETRTLSQKTNYEEWQKTLQVYRGSVKTAWDAYTQANSIAMNAWSEARKACRQKPATEQKDCYAKARAASVSAHRALVDSRIVAMKAAWDSRQDMQTRYWAALKKIASDHTHAIRKTAETLQEVYKQCRSEQ